MLSLSLLLKSPVLGQRPVVVVSRYRLRLAVVAENTQAWMVCQGLS